MTIYYFMAVTGFVTGLMALVGFVSDWWYNQRQWRRALSRTQEALQSSRNEARQFMQTLEVQQQINKTLGEDLAQLRVFRRHHSARLRDLEDVILRLNDEPGPVRYTFDGGHAVKITASISSAAGPDERSRAAHPDERSEVGVRSNQQELEHTQPLPAVPPLKEDWRVVERIKLP